MIVDVLKNEISINLGLPIVHRVQLQVYRFTDVLTLFQNLGRFPSDMRANHQEGKFPSNSRTDASFPRITGKFTAQATCSDV